MWTVIGESAELSRDAHKDMEGSHAYMILTQEDSSMVSVSETVVHRQQEREMELSRDAHKDMEGSHAYMIHGGSLCPAVGVFQLTMMMMTNPTNLLSTDTPNWC